MFASLYDIMSKVLSLKYKRQPLILFCLAIRAASVSAGTKASGRATTNIGRVRMICDGAMVLGLIGGHVFLHR